MSSVALALLTVALAGAVGPPAPAGALEGDIVEIDGELYQLKDGILYTLDDPALEDPNLMVTVSGSHLDERSQRKVVKVESITSEQIAESGAKTLGDILSQQAGIQVGSSLGLGQSVQLDGMDARHVLVLVDGKPVNGRVNSRVDVGRIPVSSSSIERVEIVRGPQSALYGSEALGGVINIITKAPSLSPHAQVDVGADVITGAVWKNVGLHLMGGLEPVAGRIDVTAQDLPGLDRSGLDADDKVISRPDGKDDVPDRRQLGLHMEALLPLLDFAELRASIDGSDSISAALLAPSVPFRDRARSNELGASAGMSADLTDTTTLDLDIGVSRFRHVFEKVPRGDVFEAGFVEHPFCGAAGMPFFDPACPSDAAIRTDAVGDQGRFEARLTTTILDRVAMALPIDLGQIRASAGGVVVAEEATRVNGAGENTLPGGGTRDTGSLYTELLWKPRPWLAILPGARADAYTPSSTDENWAFGPKIGLRVDWPFETIWPLNGAYVRASYGRGFRLPSFEERLLRFDHSEVGYVVQGNDKLLPETSNGVRAEIGYSPLLTVSLSVEVYLNMVDQLITERVDGRDDAGIPVFTYENASRAYTSGVNTNIALGPFFGASLQLGYQYLINAVDASGCPEDNYVSAYFCSVDEGAVSLPLRPVHSLSGTLRYDITDSGTGVFARTSIASERPVDETLTAPGFVDLGFGVRQKMFDHAELTLSLMNVLDAYDPTFGPKPGRRVSVLLTLF